MRVRLGLPIRNTASVAWKAAFGTDILTSTLSHSYVEQLRGEKAVRHLQRNHCGFLGIHQSLGTDTGNRPKQTGCE